MGKSKRLAASALQQVSMERTSLVLQHWASLQTACKSSCGVQMMWICFSSRRLHKQRWHFQCLPHEMFCCWTKPVKKQEKADFTKVCLFFSDQRPGPCFVLYAIRLRRVGLGKTMSLLCVSHKDGEVWLLCVPLSPKLRESWWDDSQLFLRGLH